MADLNVLYDSIVNGKLELAVEITKQRMPIHLIRKA